MDSTLERCKQDMKAWINQRLCRELQVQDILIVMVHMHGYSLRTSRKALFEFIRDNTWTIGVNRTSIGVICGINVNGKRGARRITQWRSLDRTITSLFFSKPLE